MYIFLILSNITHLYQSYIELCQKKKLPELVASDDVSSSIRSTMITHTFLNEKKPDISTAEIICNRMELCASKGKESRTFFSFDNAPS